MRAVILSCLVMVSLVTCDSSEMRYETPSADAGSRSYIDGRLHHVPVNGFIPDSVTAIRAAEAIMMPLVGTEYVEEQRPLTAVLNRDIWTVRGTLPEGAIGATVVIEMAKADGAVHRFAVE